MSTFSYDPTIPNPPNDPADDVDQMQTNSASISGLLLTDHVGFNVSNGGSHKQLTFYSNNVPSTTTTPAFLFTNTSQVTPAPAINLNQLFYYPAGGVPAQTLNQYTSTPTNGSTYLMGGIIIKWGSGTYTTTSTSQSVTFANAFPNACFSVQVTSVAFRNGSSVQSVTSSGFTAQRGDGGGSGQGFQWIAIGN